MFCLRWMHFLQLCFNFFGFISGNITRITRFGGGMLVALYTKKMLHNLCCRAMRKNCVVLSFDAEFTSLSLTVATWLVSLERTASKRWLTWNSSIFSAIEEQGLASFRKWIKKFLFHFDSILLLVPIFTLSTGILGSL